MKRALCHPLILLAVLTAWGTPVVQAVDTTVFQPLYRPKMPTVQDASWKRDDVDLFILSKLETAHLKPNADADRPTLLRRACFDLTGLPPTDAQIAAFLRDPSPDDQAFAKVVDELLKSPRFGERWGRHWLDVVHYADSIGRTMNASFPYAFRYRDYVIDSFNADKPYNRFVAEQLAGDLIPSQTTAQKREALTGTGFLTFASLDLSAGGDEQFLLDRVDDQIDVTTRAFLGITVSCARCHNHKTDPIAQRDYYALAGIFQSSLSWPGVRGRGDLGANGYVDDEALVKLPEDATVANASRRGGGAAKGTDDDDMQSMQPTKGYATRWVTKPNVVMGVSEGEVKDCEIAIKGDPFERGEAPPRGALGIPGLPPLPKVPKDASGRLQLAQWIVTPNHPLTARVMMNRIWQHLFGRGLVRTVDDFGNTGEKATHPELLDHLAVRFVENGWSMKKMIRTLMLSHTYRLSSAGNHAKAQIDGANDLFWRMNLRRMEVEEIRDSLLWLRGDLKFDRPAGIQMAGFGGKGREARTRSLLAETEPYRTIYLPVPRAMLPEMHQLFDFPEPSQIRGEREITTVTPQALFMMNSRFVAEAADGAAKALLEEKGDDTARIRIAYLRALGRQPDKQETDTALAFLHGEKFSAAKTINDPYTWAMFVQSLMASAEFRYLK